MKNNLSNSASSNGESYYSSGENYDSPEQEKDNNQQIETSSNKISQFRELFNNSINHTLSHPRQVKAKLISRSKKEKIDDGIFIDTSLLNDKEGTISLDHHNKKALSPSHTATMTVLDKINNFKGEGLKASRKMYIDIFIELNRHKIPIDVQDELKKELNKEKTDYHFINEQLKKFNCRNINEQNPYKNHFNLYEDHLDTDSALAMIAFRNPQFARKHQTLFQKVSQYGDFSLDDKTVVLDKFTAREVAEMINELIIYLYKEISLDLIHRKKIPRNEPLNSDHVNHLVLNVLLSILPQFINAPQDFLQYLNLKELSDKNKIRQKENLKNQINNQELKINEYQDKKKNSFVFVKLNDNLVNIFALNEYLATNYPNSKLIVIEKKIYNGTKKSLSLSLNLSLNPQTENDLQTFDLENDLIAVLNQREMVQSQNLINQISKKIDYLKSEINNQPDNNELANELSYYQKELQNIANTKYDWSGRNGLISSISCLSSKDIERIILPYLKSKQP